MMHALARLRCAPSSSIVACCLGLALAAAPSCSPRKSAATPPSFLERGELFSTGTVVYDAWFKSVHDLQEELAVIPIEERNHLVPLARALNLLPSADTTVVVERLSRVRSELPSMELAIAQPDELEASLVVAGKEKLRGGAAQLGSAINTVANAELKAAWRLSDMPERARRLKELGGTLAQNAPQDLRSLPASDRDAIVREITHAIRELDRIAAEAPKERDRIRLFVRGMSGALKGVR